MIVDSVLAIRKGLTGSESLSVAAGNEVGSSDAKVNAATNGNGVTDGTSTIIGDGTS